MSFIRTATASALGEKNQQKQHRNQAVRHPQRPVDGAKRGLKPARIAPLLHRPEATRERIDAFLAGLVLAGLLVGLCV
jgi:hypothetical protein